MSSGEASLGLSDAEAAALEPDAALRVRTFRLILLLAQQLRTLMDARLRADGLTTQQAAMISVIEARGTPSLSEAAGLLGTSHQNAKQIAAALERKAFVRILDDSEDGRVRRLVTTARSKRYWRRRSAADQRQVVEWFSGLDAGEAETLFELLRRLERDVRALLDAREASR